jgi:soluble lytic murein transglycosylase
MQNHNSFILRRRVDCKPFSAISKLLICCVFAWLTATCSANDTGTPQNTVPPNNYLTKYMTYLFWVQHLPEAPKPEFVQFIEPQTPLTQKLREKWLYLLAERQDWTNFNTYYRTTDNIGLRCYAQMAHYQLGQKQEATQEALAIWILPESQASSSCQHVFTYLQQQSAFSTPQLEQKIAATLAESHYHSAFELLHKLGPSYSQYVPVLTKITQNPTQILSLKPGPVSSGLYLYGLKLMVTRKMDAAITLWQNPATRHILNLKQNQQFLAHLALYKAMRNQTDTEEWLTKVQPAYWTPTLRDWAIRYALLQKNWQQIIQITAAEPTPTDPFQIYWRARALEKLGHQSEAQSLYRNLANKRHYYGFLASIALHQAFHFESEPTSQDPSILLPYKPILEQIADYHRHNQEYLAAHTLNEFSLELSKTEKSALVYWVATHLQWPGKAIYLSTADEELNNQLMLRFPLTYQTHINKLAQQYHISSALIYATIRQESTFLEDIKSEAGAYGLMQIMPRTAQTIAKQAKISYANPKELYHPEKNLHIGVAYLNTLHHQFKAHPVLIMAAYNAGPKQVRHWVMHHPPRDIDIWIETLPWQETRNYLKNVMAFYAVYQYRMHQKPNLSPFLHPFVH